MNLINTKNRVIEKLQKELLYNNILLKNQNKNNFATINTNMNANILIFEIIFDKRQINKKKYIFFFLIFLILKHFPNLINENKTSSILIPIINIIHLNNKIKKSKTLFYIFDSTILKLFSKLKY